MLTIFFFLQMLTQCQVPMVIVLGSKCQKRSLTVAEKQSRQVHRLHDFKGTEKTFPINKTLLLIS